LEKQILVETGIFYASAELWVVKNKLEASQQKEKSKQEIHKI